MKIDTNNVEDSVAEEQIFPARHQVLMAQIVEDQQILVEYQLMNLLLLEAEYHRNLRGWASHRGNNNNLEISGDTKIWLFYAKHFCYSIN